MRALLRCGWHLEGGDENECRLVHEGREIVVPRGRLDSSVVPLLAIEAGLGPLALLSALEQTLITELHQEIWPARR